ncbi:MAG: putative Ig domain-containing protein [Acidimicrobiales bacterium]|nr:putative Ig domain-containing protein [Acidimicrobiales bacterium]
MLNIGGTLYGQSGPATGAANWTSLTVDGATGSTTTSTGTDLGSGSVTMHYTATKNSLVYTMDRTIDYTYPNTFFTESYSFTIPAGNTEVVKFYLGGDTAPGSSDQGYGIMLTNPVRSVISLNTSSQIQFGYREVAGERTFDGATSQGFSIPYSTVSAGGNIGYTVTPSNHDAGLMVQWNLGSTPGTYTGVMEEFVTYQESSLSAQFRHATFDAAVEEPFDFNFTNTLLTGVVGQGFTFAFPSGMTIGSGALTNTCGGTVTATAGTNTVTMSGVDVAATSNCVLTVPVAVSGPGNYSVSNASVSGMVGGIVNRVANSTVQATSSTNSAPSWVDQTLGAMDTGTYYNDGLVASGWPLPTYAVTAGALPAGLSLNTSTGAITGTPTTMGAYDFTITVSNGEGTDLVRQFTGTVTAPPTAPAWTDQTIAAIEVGEAYSDGVAASGSPAATYTVSAGTLPAGLSLDANTGAITGTPTTAGAYAFTIEANNGVGSPVTRAFSGTVVEGPSFDDDTLGFLQEDLPFNDGISASGTPAVTYTVSAGSLPAGLSLDANTGAITGTPTTPGAYDFTITVSNGVGTDLVRQFTGTVLAAVPPAIDLNLELEVGAPTGGDGAQVLVTGSGLLPGSDVVVEMRSNPVVIATGVADSNGNFSQYVTIPADAPSGSHSIVVNGTGAAGDPVSDTAWFTVTNTGNIGDSSSAAPLSDDFGFRGLNPSRLLDTRDSGVKLAGGTVHELTVVGVGGVPADATAVALNITATEGEAAGFITVYPCGTERPWASNVNFAAGQTIANAATTRVGAGGKVCVYTESTAHIVVDVNGANSQSEGDGRVGGLTPTRLLDTRADGGSKVPGGTVYELPVAGVGGVAAHSSAVVLNLTVTEPDAGGFATVFPCGSERPWASNLNFTAGQTVANLVTATIGTGGKVCLFSPSNTHYVVDVLAEYRSDNRDGHALAGSITRLLDTREARSVHGGAKLAAGQVVELQVAGLGDIDATAVAATLNITATNPDTFGYVTVFPCGTTMPWSSNLNYAAGLTVANSVTTALGTGGKVCVYVSHPTHLVVDFNAAYGPDTVV